MPETDAASTDSTSTTSTALARAAEVPVPEADAIAGRFPLTANPSPVAEDERQAVLAGLHFGDRFTDHMAHARWRQGEGWGDYGVIPYGNLSLSPATAVLHYGQEIFEGIKAYRHDDGSVWTFRPRYNAARLNASARRLALPELAEEDFVASLVDLVRADAAWVPSGEGESLYLRPFAFASEAFLGVRPSKVVDYYVIASPAGSYFTHGLEPISIWVTTEYHRAGRGGTGAAKTGGNYASSLLPQQEAYAQGCDQVCFLDDVSQKNLEELGGMNIMVVDADGTVRTPRLTGTILEGSTRSAIIRMLQDSGRRVVEDIISLEGLLADIESGRVREVFACGTAAVVVPLGHLKGKGFDARIEGNEVTRQVHDRLTSIQSGRAEDPYGWMYQLVPPRS
ncbi:branched-chain amino acid aminotransferase [Actinomyces johnsonii]|uniref:branched-chain-amino-acid transaminase n=1 Tax=Actinomyces johnsonii TaxID=544581 RepID=A0A508A533_9ACTO|nr:branched-chain amino acid aminotransferase [Actinomyces johnsonii]KAA8735751.1 branched-chain amino acid aminotransferase [Actinomyces johnsonii]TQD42958.1 branched-chain amino acid aminotransferase [Actinomyces johnsonii]